ncbi:MAG: diiron oxygenase [Candidatus Neomarinimicrobiota bacterium]|nr:diiron oxygenase [Candidatus Neomarinimicrobiota bacterium]
MKTLSLDKIYAASVQAAQNPSAVSFQSVDFSQPFIHEKFTQLYYTPFYSQLTHEQKLRYNQLYGIRTNEQFMLFEQDFINRVIVQLAKYNRVTKNSNLIRCMTQMVQEEKTHHKIFLDLNKLCLPEIYCHREKYFMQLNRWDSFFFNLSTSFPAYLTFLVWFIMIFEEYSIALSRSMIETEATESLGKLENNFIKAHIRHIKDETRHIHINVNLITECFTKDSKFNRKVNAFFLKTFFKDIIVPKRGGIAVFRHFIKEFPELEPQKQAMLKSLEALKNDDRFQKSLFNRELMPYTFELFDANPEFHSLERVLKGYTKSS